MGYPVVMKINTPPILHKTEVGGVMVDLRSDKEVRKAFTEMQQAGRQGQERGEVHGRDAEDGERGAWRR